MRQLRFRFRSEPALRFAAAGSATDGAPMEAWAIVRTGDELLPFALVALGPAGRYLPRGLVVYTQSVEAARAYVRSGSLSVTGCEAARLARELPARYGEVLEVWF